VLPVSRSAVGIALVAFLPTGVAADALAAEVRRTDLDRSAVERARRTRLAFADGSVIPGLAAVASPVRHWNGDAVAAVALLSRDRELARPSHHGAVALRALCDRLSKDFGARQIKEAA